MEFPVESLKKWFLENRRSLPWREDPNPYAVWVSEVMLQQTQVSVVISYFERFMRLFPNIFSLADSPLEKVLKAWEGLGYYSRAKNLYFGAKQVVENYGGVIPADADELAKIKGLGPYTVAAILAFAFRQKIAPIDANVSRVLSRYLAIEIPIEKREAKKKIEDLAARSLPEKEPWVIGEALIELGALICAKKPQCSACPLRSGCLAYRHHKQHELPKKRERPSTVFLYKHVGVIFHRGKCLVKKGGRAGRVLADLFEFPALDGDNAFLEIEKASQAFEVSFFCKLKGLKTLPKQQQSYTCHRVALYPYLFELETQKNPDGEYLWQDFASLDTLPFSSGHKRILQTIDYI